MAFDEVVLPLRLKYGSKGGPRFRTEIVSVASGFEQRNQKWAQARRVYDARTGVVSAADASLLIAFFHARAGRARGFRLKDWSDYTSASDGKSAPAATDQLLGTGDGSRTAFQLVKSYGDAACKHERVIAKPVEGSVKIALNDGTVASGWSVDCTKGVVTFDVAPPLGVRVSAGFAFDVPVRFDTDCLSLTAEDKNTALAEIPVVEVRV